MPSPPPPGPPPREPVAVTPFMWVGIILVELATFAAFLSGLRGYDILEVMMPFMKACGCEGLLVMIGWAPPPKQLTKLQRVVNVFRKMLPGGKKLVKSTLGAWGLQSAKDMVIPIWKKGVALLSTHFVPICLLALLAVACEILAETCNTKDEVRRMRNDNDEAHKRIVDMITLDVLPRLDAIERSAELQARGTAVAASATSPGLVSFARECVKEHYDVWCGIMDGIP